MTTIDSFRGEYYFLSNFYPCKIEYEGLIYDNSEAAFQAMKCTNPGYRVHFVGIEAYIAKRKGKMVELKKDWENVKDFYMYDIAKEKFIQNSDLKEKLLETGNAELIENNNWGDDYWGMCKGRGKNKLGKILMKVREELRNLDGLV